MTRALVFLVAAAELFSGCNNLTCGPGTEEFTDPVSGQTSCVGPSADAGVTCNDANASIQGGVCSANFTVVCGTGTAYDPTTQTCISTVVNHTDGGVTPTAPSCAGHNTTGFCISGVVRFLKDNSYTLSTPLEVRAYNPLTFLNDPTSPPAATVMTDAMGTYLLPNLKDGSGLGLIAIAVTDPSTAKTKTYALAGSGLNNVAGTGEYSLDLFAVEQSMVAGWDTGAGLAAGTLEKSGAYVARFRDGALMGADDGGPVAGVVLDASGAAAKPQFFFSGSYGTIDTKLTATDGTTGAAVWQTTPGALGSCTATGGGDSWPTAQCASAANVVFIQTFHPMSM